MLRAVTYAFAMSVASFEGIIENGKIKLPDSIRVPDRTKVYVVIPGATQPCPMSIMSPRLANPEQAKDFKKTLIPDAKL